MNESAGFLAEDGKNSIRNELFSPTYKEEMIMVKRRKRAAKKAHKKTKARRKTRRTKARKTTAGKKGIKKRLEEKRSGNHRNAVSLLMLPPSWLKSKALIV